MIHFGLRLQFPTPSMELAPQGFYVHAPIGCHILQLELQTFLKMPSNLLLSLSLNARRHLNDAFQNFQNHRAVGAWGRNLRNFAPPLPPIISLQHPPVTRRSETPTDNGNKEQGGSFSHGNSGNYQILFNPAPLCPARVCHLLRRWRRFRRRTVGDTGCTGKGGQTPAHARQARAFQG